ncbi:MAG: hypothetical protein V7637_574 [Mycobacteriales bacterium]
MRPVFARFKAGLLALVLAGPIAAVPPATAAGAAAPTVAPSVAPAAGSVGGGAVVTLLTGDRVRRLAGADGEPAVAVEPAAGREHVGFVRESRPAAGGDHLSVVPADALPLLAAGRLDPRLFDVTELTREGFTAGRPLPLIVTYGRSRGPGRPLPAGARAVRALPSIDGTAVLAEPGRGPAMWAWLTGTARQGGTAGTVGPAGTGGGTPRALADGIRTVWLDALAHPALDVSVPQIGAPVAWRSGFTGRGVTIGVLDTGIAADHPDLAGRVAESRDFTGTRPDAGDDVGHGTHVAGVLAGSGAASGGRYRGVAPDATLLNGKVCVSSGCPTSAVIAGMEWAAPQARVVNLSVVAAATDGTDPLSQAVDQLTARYGTLFVAAAGNGDPSGAVAAPAAADAALAVGSVDAADRTSPFSSRGPRRGDYAVKPDIAAPGDGIVSARASGTPGGDADPVDAYYARMSGTSIAAPHVAGAAALLAQQHPDWTAALLKSTLMSTALPTAAVFEQGAGRVDLARAVSQPVTATSGSLSYGFFAWPRGRPVSRSVRYRNDGDAAVTLRLDLAATGPDGRPAPGGLFAAAVPAVTVPAHGTADVPVTADPAAAGAGRYGGRLTATAPGVAVSTAVAAVLEPESYDLTLTLVSRTGHFEAGVAQAVDTTTGAVFGIRPFSPDGTAVVRLPRGRYDINAFDFSADPGNTAQPLAVTLLSEPDMNLVAGAAVRLDATAGQPVRAVADRPSAVLQVGELGLVSGRPAAATAASLSWLASSQYQLFAVPSRRPVTAHTYAFFFRATLAAAAPDTDPATPVYQLAFLHRGGIPARTAFRVHDRELARVAATDHTQGAPAVALRADFARLPLPFTGLGVFQVYRYPLPVRRTEFYTADPQVTWQHLLAVLGGDNESDGEVHTSIRSYRPGRSVADWNAAPLGPAFGDPGDGWGVTRVGDQLQVAVTLLSGADPHQYTSPPGAMTGTTTLSRDGVELGTSPAAGSGSFPLASGPGRYTLRSTASRVVPWSVIGTQADVTWTFREAGAAAAAVPPLFVIRAVGPVDLADRARAGAGYRLSLLAQQQPGAPPVRLAGLRVEASVDDGASWRPVPTVHGRGGGLALLRNPAGGFVSLRISARDLAGDTVTQTVLRAYQVAPG